MGAMHPASGSLGEKNCLQAEAVAVQILGGLGSRRTLAIGSSMRVQALLVEYGMLSGLGLTGHETGIKPCPVSPGHSPPLRHQGPPAPPRAFAVAQLLRAQRMVPLLPLPSFCGHSLSPQSLSNEQWTRTG